MILLSSLTPTQRATISNTICGDAASARELEDMGLLRILRVEPGPRGRIAYFDLTPIGDEFVNLHFVIPTEDP
jgi:hypothetical protein